jgi:hypothetical protein
VTVAVGLATAEGRTAGAGLSVWVEVGAAVTTGF